VKCLVIAGPGFAKDTFKTYLEAEAVRRDVRPLIENKASIITAQVGVVRYTHVGVQQSLATKKW
jgi:stalled ribosome rescue protein Dom34